MFQKSKQPNFTPMALGIFGYWLLRARLVLGFWGLVVLALCAHLMGAL